MKSAFLFIIALLGSSIVYADEDGSGEGSGVEPTTPVTTTTIPDTTTTRPVTTTTRPVTTTTRPVTTTTIPVTTTTRPDTTTPASLCEEFGNTCDENAYCYEQGGSFGCICKDGYTGNGFSCEDINECNADPCAEYANCNNSEGSFSCTCRNGFFGNGYERCLSREKSMKFLQEVGKSFNPFARVFSFWFEVSEGLRRFHVENIWTDKWKNSNTQPSAFVFLVEHLFN